MKTEPIGLVPSREEMERERVAQESKEFLNKIFHPKIKQLEWEFYGAYYSARTPIGDYTIKEDVNYYDISNGGYILTYDGMPIGKRYLVFDLAKAAAQNNFDNRVRECLMIE